MIDSIERIRFFMEFALSQRSRPFVEFILSEANGLRGDRDEGFRMATILIPLLRHNLFKGEGKGEGE